MARMPGAKWAGEHSPRTPMSHYDIVCLHTIVGHDPAHAAHFSTGGDGLITQSRDTKYRSAANLNGNHRVLAVENEDMGAPFPNWGGDGRKVPPFTAKQVESLARIIAWAHKTHGIPIQACPNSRPGSRGVAFHRQGIDGNFRSYRHGGRVDGGEVWTLSPGKVCPGDNRIDQIPQIIARARVLAGMTAREAHVNHVQTADSALKVAKRQIQIAINELSAAPKSRVVVRARIVGLKTALGIVSAAEKALTS